LKRRDCQFSADDGFQTGFTRCLMKSRSAIHAIRVEQRDRGIPERGGTLDERFGKRCTLKKTERRGAMQFDVHGRQ
jgi:hypothetical protein